LHQAKSGKRFYHDFPKGDGDASSAVAADTAHRGEQCALEPQHQVCSPPPTQAPPPLNMNLCAFSFLFFLLFFFIHNIDFAKNILQKYLTQKLFFAQKAYDGIFDGSMFCVFHFV
jgi:hypothetical protein